MPRIVLGSVLLLLAVGGWAQEAEGPDRFLGWSPEAVYRELGAPSEVFVAPIDATRNHVGHFYPDFITLFWWSNHVWQVRLDRRYTGAFLGLHMGMSRADVVGVLGPSKAASPAGVLPEWAAWSLPFRSFSRVLKLGFENGVLVDALVTRGDLP